MTPQPLSPVVPIKHDEIKQLIPLIQALLKDDEAGPAYFIATPEWIEATNYEEPPF